MLDPLGDSRPDWRILTELAARMGYDGGYTHPSEIMAKCAPSITGIYRMLNDDELWYAIKPILAGLRAFSEQLDRPENRPVTDFTGTPTEES